MSIDPAGEWKEAVEKSIVAPPRGEAETQTDTPEEIAFVEKIRAEPHRHRCVEILSDGYRCKVRKHCVCECGARQQQFSEIWKETPAEGWPNAD